MNSVALLLLMAGIILLVLSARSRRSLGLPRGRIVQTDADGGGRAINSNRLRLSGKPDYEIQCGENSIPVEVKPGWAGLRFPWHNDVLQLATYLLLLEERDGCRPPFGRLVYRSGPSFDVPYSDELREELLDVMGRMRRDMSARDLLPEHTDPRRCWSCGYQGKCCREIR